MKPEDVRPLRPAFAPDEDRNGQSAAEIRDSISRLRPAFAPDEDRNSASRQPELAAR